MKRALIFVAIPTQFREMIRVARLLRGSGRFEPLVLFSAAYFNWERDAEICQKERIETDEIFADSFRRKWILGLGEGEGTPGAAAISAEVTTTPAAGTSSRPARIRPTEKIPRFARPAIQQTWRWIYRRYWAFRLRLSAPLGDIWWSSVVLAQVLRVVIFGKNLGSVAAPQLESPGERTTSTTSVGRYLVAAFGELWERGVLPSVIREKKNLYQALPNFFREEHIALLVLPEDNYFLDTQFFVHAAHQAGTKSVVVPFTVVNSLEWAETFLGRLAHSVQWPPNFLMAKAFPRWVYKHKGQKMIMPAIQILMMEYLGLTPAKPWLINSGFADALAAESPFMVDYYREAGIDDRRVVLTGSLADDELHSQIALAAESREALYARLGLPPNRPMILYSVPPNQLIGDGRVQSEFSSYETLIKSMLEVACACKGWNVVLSLHPRINHGDVVYVGSYPSRIALEDIASLIPLCDLFIASASATIRLAAAAGKPTVNYDVYRYQYSDFLSIPGVMTMDNIGAFKNAVESITGNPAYREELAAEQRKFAKGKALVDGRSGDRLLALFDRLTDGAIPNRAGDFGENVSAVNHATGPGMPMKA